jgi:tetratricopeptide (TPR) repeat protein
MIRHPLSTLASMKPFILLAATLVLMTPTWAQDRWNVLIQEAGGLMARGAYAESQKKYEEARAEVERSLLADDYLSVTLNNLAALYRTQARYPEAEQSYQQALVLQR